MKIFIFISMLSALNSFASVFGEYQYPEDRVYTSADRGLRAYRALSLYKTGTFALTFDDGPHPTQTALILDILKKHDTKATFFVLTDLVTQENYHLIKRMLDEGHIVASHGPGHERSANLPKEAFKAQVKKSFLDLAKWYKKSGHELTKFYFRFPFGDYGTRTDYHHINALKEVSQELLGDNCIHMAFWDVDTADWVPGMSAKEVASNILAHFTGGTFMDFKKVGDSYVKVPVEITNPPQGGIILQHDVREPSVQGTDLFLKQARNKGIKIVPLDEIEEFRITKDCRL
ncbi:MAG TPA: polysaccharide deacetylase family protein [Bacteriovoracaceae bacterium]|nr:polysaccharide deacetylase family protein [Bacteriovoracaceae bacterium]